MVELNDMQSKDFPICTACGQQYGGLSTPAECFICQDARQFVPSHGQTWTTLKKMREENYKNVFTKLPHNGKLAAWSIHTEPKFAIGQRAILLLDEHESNTLWDCIAYLDENTVDRIKEQGGIGRICISHPHYYSTALDWAAVFDCPIFISKADEMWITRQPQPEEQMNRNGSWSLLPTEVEHLTQDLSFCRIGGHFDGSAVLHSKRHEAIFTGDTISLTPANRRITIMWSYPNMIPLDGKTVAEVCWPRLKRLAFSNIYSKFVGEDLLNGGKEMVERSFEEYCSKLNAPTDAFKMGVEHHFLS